MTMHTDRLNLREFSLEDADNLYKLHSDPDVMQFIASPMAQSLKDATLFIENQMAYYKENKGLGIFPIFLHDSGRFTGWAAIRLLDDTTKVELGYRLVKKYWGIGLATEITESLIRHGFENLRLKELYGVTNPKNIKSQRVLKKCGLSFIGMDKYYQHEVSVFKIENTLSEPGLGP
jgi:[ribosomal protein S5]-alanine N-acetyltransferase